MGNAPAVSIQTTLGNNLPAVPHLNHALLTGVPQATAFLDAWAASTQDWVFGGLVLELTQETWQSRLKSLGATSAEPIWTAVDAFWNQLAVPDARGFRPDITKTDVLYVGRRTRAVDTVNTFTFTNNTAGSVIITVNPSKNLFTTGVTPGALAEVTVEADGVLTVDQLASAATLALNNLTAFSQNFLASSALGVVTITSLQPGYPLVLFIRNVGGGPTMTQAITTANVAGAYEDDLDDLQAAAEFGPDVDPPRRRWYWITDLQSDDAVNAEGMAWVENQGDPASFVPIRDYQFVAWSSSGARLVTVGGNQVGNFNPTATDSAAQEAMAANNNEGWHRSGVHDHDRYEFLAPALLGRTIGYRPGEVSFTSKVLYGGTAASRMSPRDFGDDETLTFERQFNWYSAEGSGLRGSAKWGYLADGRYMDQKWTEDYVSYQVRVDLLDWMQQSNIVTYTDPDIKAGEATIKMAMAKVPAVIPASIGVVSLTRDQVNPANIVARVYYDYIGTGQAAGVVNRIGTPSDPVPIFISTI